MDSFREANSRRTLPCHVLPHWQSSHVANKHEADWWNDGRDSKSNSDDAVNDQRCQSILKDGRRVKVSQGRDNPM